MSKLYSDVLTLDGSLFRWKPKENLFWWWKGGVNNYLAIDSNHIGADQDGYELSSRCHCFAHSRNWDRKVTHNWLKLSHDPNHQGPPWRNWQNQGPNKYLPTWDQPRFTQILPTPDLHLDFPSFLQDPPPSHLGIAHLHLDKPAQHLTNFSSDRTQLLWFVSQKPP